MSLASLGLSIIITMERMYITITKDYVEES